MANQQNVMEISQIGGRLADHITALSGITERIGDDTSTYILRKMEPRMRQGLVRVAVIGVTSTGKSTAINALVNALALPENPSVSTPIPVWIGYQSAGETSATIYENKDGRLEAVTCDLNTFKTKYCYNIEDILKKDRTRYDNVAFGSVNTGSPLLEKGVVLIDTLGISATTVDSRKTIRVLKEGVDAVVFLTKNSNLNIAEKRFIYQYVLGCRDAAGDNGGIIGEEGVKAVLPENLFIVHNDWTGNVSRIAFKASVRVLYEDSGMDMDDERIDDLVDNNVFFINAFKARLGSLGVYPYVDCAPEGSNAAARASMQKREAFEQNTLAAGDARKMYEASGIKPLADAVRKKGEQLCRGRNSVAVRRINELIEVVDGVIRASDERIGNINISITSLDDKKREIANIEAANRDERKNITTAIPQLKGDYTESFKKLVKDMEQDMFKACESRAAGMPMPDGFADQYQAYRGMSTQQREAYLKAMLPEVIEDITGCCTEMLLEALDSNQRASYKTPFEVMADVEKVISNQEILLNGYIDSLRKLGVEGLGAALPERIIVKELYGELKRDLEEKIKAIIAGACRLKGDDFQATMQRHVAKCQLNFFQRILGGLLPNAADRLWNKIIEELFKPLAQDVVTGMTVDTAESILSKTEAAFSETMIGICESHIRLFTEVEKAIGELEKLDGNFAAWRGREETFARELKKECGKIKDDIQAVSYQLMHG